jgi:hypothetical protein
VRKLIDLRTISGRNRSLGNMAGDPA